MSEWDILSKDDIKIIQDSYKKLSDKHQETGDYLYNHLFKSSPDVSNIFKGDMKEQSMTLMKMIKTVVEGLNNVQIIMPAIQQMGNRHIDYGVSSDHFKHFKSSLLYAIEKVLGPDFNSNVKNSWSKLYDVLEEIMRSK